MDYVDFKTPHLQFTLNFPYTATVYSYFNDRSIKNLQVLLQMHRPRVLAADCLSDFFSKLQVQQINLSSTPVNFLQPH